jgi:ankyrin repeat protein
VTKRSWTHEERIADEFTTAAWQDETGAIDKLARENPWLVDPASPYLLQALHTACASCQQNAAQQLVEQYHADVNKLNEQGMNALHEAMSAADMVTAKMLIRNGADINMPTRSTDGFVDGWTPLHFAVSHRDTEMMLFLLNRGSDPSVKESHGMDVPAFARNDKREDLAVIVEKFRPSQQHTATPSLKKNGPGL